MSSQGRLIVCRECHETIPIEEGSCPHCGTAIRGNAPYVAGILFGLIVVGASLLRFGELFEFGVLGLLIAGTATYLFYNKRRRVRQASVRS